MSTTVLEALQSAQVNFETVGKMGARNHPIFAIAMAQLGNAITALKNEMKPNDVLQEHPFGDVKTAP